MMQYLNTMSISNNQSLVIQDLLKNPNCQVEDLLDEDALIQEFKDSKPNVINLFAHQFRQLEDGTTVRLYSD